MPQFALALNLRDDPQVIAEYEAHHRKVWPEVLAAIRATGVEDIKIYRHGRHLFMTITGPEGFDPVGAFAEYEHDPVVQRWEALMRTFQEPLPGAPPGRWWTRMACIFDLAGEKA
ncbi:MAG TPA: L-rhamnose mutarotase [Bauldia sp.]|nr:L-rhamnose mutarotase [Bauldia sp.]